MTPTIAPWLRPVFQPDSGPIRALVVAGACGNVGLGKLGQFARLLARHRVPIVALDPSPAVHGVKDQIRGAYGERFAPAQVQAILDNVIVVQGGVGELPHDLRIGLVFEAIPEHLPTKQSFYRELRAREPEALIFSATSGFPTQVLFEGLPGASRCGVLHPFYPHLTSKLWELPSDDAVTGEAELEAIRTLLTALGMNVIHTRDAPAFVADRLFCGLMLEAVRVHAELGLSPAQVDDVCKTVLGTSPFYVHNLIPGSNYLSAHCMELLRGEVDSTLFTIPDTWRPYIEDANLRWPYERGQKAPPELFGEVRDRLLGMLFCLTAYILEHDLASIDAVNFLCEHALAFREGAPALIERIGLPEAQSVAEAFLATRGITAAEDVAPLAALDEQRPGWWNVYVHNAVHGSVGLLSLKRLTLSDTFLAELERAYDVLQADPEVKAIVIAPDGVYSREFGHGADLQAFVPVLGNYEASLDLIRRWKTVLVKLRRGKPTVAAMVGRVLGGSLELALACHARIAGERTHLQFPETTVGVIPGLGGCHMLHRWCRPEFHARISELLLTGHAFGADDAARFGLVQEVVAIPDLPLASMKIAAALGSGAIPRPSFREDGLAITVDRRAAPTNEVGVPLDAELRELLAQTIEQANAVDVTSGSAIEERAAAQSLTLGSAEIGVKAILQGRPPKFLHPV